MWAQEGEQTSGEYGAPVGGDAQQLAAYAQQMPPEVYGGFAGYGPGGEGGGCSCSAAGGMAMGGAMGAGMDSWGGGGAMDAMGGEYVGHPGSGGEYGVPAGEYGDRGAQAEFDGGGYSQPHYAQLGHPNAPMPSGDGPCVAVNALSFRQPFASLTMYGVKSLECRNRPMLKHTMGPLAIHVSHREEPLNGPLVSTAVAILRRRFPDEAISQLFQLPPQMAQGYGCIVGLVDVESTWHADLFNELEQSQLTEQAVYPVQGTFVTQLKSPRWLKYPVRCNGSNRLWQVQLPLDALPEGAELDANGNIMCVAMRDFQHGYSQQGGGGGGGGGGAARGGRGAGRAAQQQGGGSPPLQAFEGDEGLGLLGADMARQLSTGPDGQDEAEKKRKKLHKALRQIDELKAKQAAGATLEKTQESKIAREPELLAELGRLNAAPAAADGADAEAEATAQ